MQLTLEAETPLAIGSGQESLVNDRLVMRDANGLPYIPGTGLAGVLRHSLAKTMDEAILKNLFGFQDKEPGGEGRGSRLIVSAGYLLSHDGERVLEGLQDIDFSHPFYNLFTHLPCRDHVRITHQGGADTKGAGKYEEEIVYAGTRFVCALELIGDEKDHQHWLAIQHIINSHLFALGGGTRKGFGRLRNCLDLTAVNFPF
jgi:CRISPR/Cas system CMR subunit Cmr4 (Cas7 group RAMP superfamily)